MTATAEIRSLASPPMPAGSLPAFKGMRIAPPYSAADTLVPALSFSDHFSATLVATTPMDGEVDFCDHAQTLDVDETEGTLPISQELTIPEDAEVSGSWLELSGSDASPVEDATQISTQTNTAVLGSEPVVLTTPEAAPKHIATHNPEQVQAERIVEPATVNAPSLIPLDTDHFRHDLPRRTSQQDQAIQQVAHEPALRNGPPQPDPNLPQPTLPVARTVHVKHEAGPPDRIANAATPINAPVDPQKPSEWLPATKSAPNRADKNPGSASDTDKRIQNAPLNTNPAPPGTTWSKPPAIRTEAASLIHDVAVPDELSEFPLPNASPNGPAPSLAAQSPGTTLPTPVQSLSLQNAHMVADASITLKDTGGRIDVTLNPEDLGRLTIKIETSGSQPVVTLTADRPDTQDMLLRHFDLLERQFQAMGFGDLSLQFGDHGQAGDSTSGGAAPEDDAIAETLIPPVTLNAPQMTAPSGALDIRI